MPGHGISKLRNHPPIRNHPLKIFFIFFRVLFLWAHYTRILRIFSKKHMAPLPHMLFSRLRFFFSPCLLLFIVRALFPFWRPYFDKFFYFAFFSLPPPHHAQKAMALREYGAKTHRLGFRFLLILLKWLPVRSY